MNLHRREVAPAFQPAIAEWSRVIGRQECRRYGALSSPPLGRLLETLAFDHFPKVSPNLVTGFSSVLGERNAFWRERRRFRVIEARSKSRSVGDARTRHDHTNRTVKQTSHTS